MAADVKFSVKDAVGKQLLAPVTVSDELKDKFLKKSRSSSWKLLPVSIIVSAVIILLVVLAIVFLSRFVFSLMGIIGVFFLSLLFITSLQRQRPSRIRIMNSWQVR